MSSSAAVQPFAALRTASQANRYPLGRSGRLGLVTSCKLATGSRWMLWTRQAAALIILLA